MSVSVEAVCVDPKRVEEFWPHVKPMIERAYGAADELLPDLSEDFRSGSMLLWVAWAGDEKQILAAATTRLLKFRSGLVCKIIACGGSGLQRWKALHHAIEQYAKAEGCMEMQIDGRDGWARVLQGYRRTIVTLRKKI